MIRYETLLLLHPDCDDATLNMVQKRYSDLATEYQGAVLSFDVWGKYWLSYPVKKQEYGVYALARFELPEAKVTEALKELQHFFQLRCENIVLRFINKRLEQNTPLEYQKPEAVVPGERLNRDSSSSSESSERDEMMVDTSLLTHSASIKQPVA